MSGVGNEPDFDMTRFNSIAYADASQPPEFTLTKDRYLLTDRDRNRDTQLTLDSKQMNDAINYSSLQFKYFDKNIVGESFRTPGHGTEEEAQKIGD